jgi:hypothetical protein
MVPADSHKASPTSRYSGYCWDNGTYVYEALTLYSRASHPVPLHCIISVSQPYNPGHAVTWPVWALSLSLATTQEIICYFLLLCLLRCFSSAGLRTMCGMSSTCRVSPFGNPRIKSYLLIPAAYRSLSRPSSPLRAKASPVYSFLLSSTHMPFAPYGVLF